MKILNMKKYEKILMKIKKIHLTILTFTLAFIGLTTFIYFLDVDPWVNIFGNLAICINAVLATLFVFLILPYFKKNEKKFWLGFGIGIGLWSIAEILWAILEVILKIELPYPSIADGFWIVGYLPILIAFYFLFSSLFIKNGKRKILTVFYFAFLFFLIWIMTKPIFYAELNNLEKFFDIAYPALDFILFGLVLYAIPLFKSKIGRFFALICIGLLLMTTSDLAFSYFTWKEIYETWPYYLIDIPYALSYWFILLALISYKEFILKIKKKIKKK